MSVFRGVLTMRPVAFDLSVFRGIINDEEWFPVPGTSCAWVLSTGNAFHGCWRSSCYFSSSLNVASFYRSS